MNLPHLPIMAIDFLGSSLMILVSYATFVNFARHLKKNPSNVMLVYLFWFSLALFIFALSRSLGHIVKHILFALGRGDFWSELSPYSGAVNTAAMIVISAVTLFFKQMQEIFLTMEHDQRKLRQSSRELLRMNREMNRLIGERTRSELALRLAHEIRNPIMVIGGLLKRFYKSDVDPVHLKKDYIPVMMKEAEHLEGIVKKFERLFSADAAAFVQLDLSRLVRGCVDEWREVAEKKGIKVIVATDAPGLLFKGNHQLLRLAILHILNNALEVCGPGDTITVRLGAAHEGVSVEIQDTGPGMGQDIREHIFDALEDRERENMGLGLPFVKQVVEQHNGSMVVESEPGKGTKVRLEFPTYLREDK